MFLVFHLPPIPAHPGPQFEPIEILGMNQILQDQTRIFKKKEKFHFSGLDHDDHESDAYQDDEVDDDKDDDEEEDKDRMLAGWLRSGCFLPLSPSQWW